MKLEGRGSVCVHSTSHLILKVTLFEKKGYLLIKTAVQFFFISAILGDARVFMAPCICNE